MKSKETAVETIVKTLPAVMVGGLGAIILYRDAAYRWILMNPKRKKAFYAYAKRQMKKRLERERK